MGLRGMDSRRAFALRLEIWPASGVGERTGFRADCHRSNRSVPANPINRAIKGLTADAVVRSQVDARESLSICEVLTLSLGVKRHDLVETGFRRGRAGLIPDQWFQIDDKGGQQHLSVGQDFRLSYRVVDFPYLRKTVHYRP